MRSRPSVQARRCLEIILAALAEAGATPADVVRTRTFLTDTADAGVVGAVHGEVFGEVRPASTMVAVSALLDPRWKVEIEAEALIRGLNRGVSCGWRLRPGGRRVGGE